MRWGLMPSLLYLYIRNSRAGRMRARCVETSQPPYRIPEASPALHAHEGRHCKSPQLELLMPRAGDCTTSSDIKASLSYSDSSFRSLLFTQLSWSHLRTAPATQATFSLIILTAMGNVASHHGLTINTPCVVFNASQSL